MVLLGEANLSFKSVLLVAKIGDKVEITGYVIESEAINDSWKLKRIRMGVEPAPGSSRFSCVRTRNGSWTSEVWVRQSQRHARGSSACALARCVGPYMSCPGVLVQKGHKKRTLLRRPCFSLKFVAASRTAKNAEKIAAKARLRNLEKTRKKNESTMCGFSFSSERSNLRTLPLRNWCYLFFFWLVCFVSFADRKSVRP